MNVSIRTDETADAPTSRTGFERGRADANLRRFLVRYRALGAVLALLSLAAWIHRPVGWTIGSFAAAVVHVLGVTVALRQVGHRPRTVVLTITGVVWALTIIGALLAPELLPITSLSPMPPALMAMPYLSRRDVRRVLAGAGAVTVIVTLIPLGPDLTDTASLVDERFYTAALVLLAPGLVALISVIGWQSHLMLERQATALASARERLVAAAEGERRRVRSDVESSAIRRIAEATELLRAGPPTAASLAAATEVVQTAVADLRRVVLGLRPAALSEHGLEAALRLAVGPSLEVEGSVGRLADAQEGALWFGCRESVAALDRVVGRLPGAGSSQLIVRGTPQAVHVTARIDASADGLATADGLGGRWRTELTEAVQAIDDRLSTVDGYASWSVSDPPGVGTGRSAATGARSTVVIAGVVPRADATDRPPLAALAGTGGP